MDAFGPPITFGNSIVPINPLTATMGQPVLAGSEPKKMVITDNGQHIYAALDVEGAVARFDLLPKAVGLRFSLGNDVPFHGPRYVEDLQLAPGSTTTLAISRMHKNGTPRQVGVAIYDSGVQRPTTTATEFPTHFDNNNAIEYSSSPTTIYGYVSAEDVRLTPNTDFAQVIFRLPNNLAPGVCTAKIKAHAQTSNSRTFRIRI
jgi:hypothetical protein